MKKVLFLIAMFLCIGSLSVALAAEAPHIITKEELQERMNSGEVVIMDARSKKAWESSEFKIKGAVRTAAKKIDEWLDSIPKDKTLVIYCA